MKRFTASELWEKEWFLNLNPRLKLFWIYLTMRCDCAGVWEPNFPLASFMIGDKVSEKDMKEFDDKILLLANGKWWLTKFIGFQYGELSESCPAHKPIFKSIHKNGLKSKK